jgi:hypothetical protein
VVVESLRVTECSWPSQPDRDARRESQPLSPFFPRLVEKERIGMRRPWCVTSPVNTSSLAFHRSLGFHLGGRTDDSLQVSIYQDYDGPGEDRVLLTKEL